LAQARTCPAGDDVSDDDDDAFLDDKDDDVPFFGPRCFYFWRDFMIFFHILCAIQCDMLIDMITTTRLYNCDSFLFD